jgi:hypothetical protein
MKKLILISGIVAMSTFTFLNTSIAANGCTRCSSGSDECTRVITEEESEEEGTTTTVHIFYGKANPC